MNEDDLRALEELRIEELRKRMESSGLIMVDSAAKDTYDVAAAHRDLGDSLRGMIDVGHGDSVAKRIFGGVSRERTKTIQSTQKVPYFELRRIPEDRREEFLDHVKERALQGMLEQADLINAVSYEEGFDHATGDKVITAKLNVVIE